MTPTLRRRPSAHLRSAQEIADELYRRGDKRITPQRVHQILRVAEAKVLVALAGMRR